MPELPPDRQHIASEQRHPSTYGLHRLTDQELLQRFAVTHDETCAAFIAARPALLRWLSKITPGFLRGGRLVMCGAGTSGRLAVLDASEIPPTFCSEPDRVIGLIAGGDGALRRSSEGAEDDPRGFVAELTDLQLTADDCVLGIAAGGTTPIVRGALDWAAELATPPQVALLSCVAVAAPHPDIELICAPTGPELLTGSTRLKAGTVTKMVLNALSTTLMIRSGKVFDNLMIDVRASNVKLRDRAIRLVLTLCPQLDREQAGSVLAAAGWRVKTAVLMTYLSYSLPQAEAHLAQADSLNPWYHAITDSADNADKLSLFEDTVGGDPITMPLPQSLPAGWEPGPKGGMQREVQCANYRAAQALVNFCADLAEELQHHPDITWSWTRVQIYLITHDAGYQLTGLDWDMAQRIDAYVERSASSC